MLEDKLLLWKFKRGSGAVIERYEYDVYGKPTIYNSAFGQSYNNSQHGNSYLFTGRRIDILDGSSLTTYYYRARCYNPKTGRFLARDPLGTDPAGSRNNIFSILKESICL